LTGDEFIQVGRCHRPHRRINDGWIRPVAARLNDAVNTPLSNAPRGGRRIVIQRARGQYGGRVYLMLAGKHWHLLGPLGFDFSGYLAAISKFCDLRGAFMRQLYPTHQDARLSASCSPFLARMRLADSLNWDLSCSTAPRQKTASEKSGIEN
jgi:hypothetical protein